MKIVVTGADQPLGTLLSRRLGEGHEVVAIGATVEPNADPEGPEYLRVDLRLPEQVDTAIAGADAVVHAMPFDPPEKDGDRGEVELLDRVARGTYVLAMAAQKSGVRRLILISQMGLLEDYPEEYVVRPDWQPLPRAEAGSLAPHMAELACREIARMGRLEAICLRFGALDEEEGTLAEDAVGAVEKALVVEALRGGYGWELHHVVSGGRFAAAR